MAVAAYPAFILLVTVLLISCLRGTVALVDSKLTINLSEAACRWHAYTHALSLAIKFKRRLHGTVKISGPDSAVDCIEQIVMHLKEIA